jgi:hypothetical protein
MVIFNKMINNIAGIKSFSDPKIPVEANSGDKNPKIGVNEPR